MIQEMICPAEGICAGAFRKTGTQNRQKNEPCGDVVHMVRTPEFCFFGLADGQSGKRFGAAGGKRSLEILEDYIRRQGIGALSEYPFPDELPCMLMREVRSGILALMKEQGGEFSDYASTLLAVAIDPAAGRYFLVHIGDGCAIALRQEALLMLSPPDNGIAINHTWLTTSDNAVAHLRLRCGSLQEVKRLILLTDGADGLCRGKNIPRQAAQLLSGGTRDAIFAQLEDREAADDTGCIVIDLFL